MAAMSTYNVRAKRWKHGWELHIDGIGVTQSRNLDGAEEMVRDYIETLTDHDTADDAVVIRPEVGGGLDEAADAAREAIAEAEQALRAAAARSRQVARQLRQEGLSGRDIAAILHVSAQRVSQLLKSRVRP
jgi:DNA-directed RNA polymerase specialized sigma24 family protein